jgi:hypothetical protein
MGLFDWLRKEPRTAVRDGAAPSTAILVNAVHEEYGWILQNCRGWNIRSQSCTEIDGRSYDVLTLHRESDGVERRVYFDISSFMSPG